MKYPQYKVFSIKVKVFDNWSLIKQSKEKLKTEEGKILYSKRMAIVEKIFGQIKNNLNFKKYLVRSIGKVKTKWSLICSTYNLKRIFNSNMKTV